MKIIAFYLPQYHEIEENNRWWGKGFTEWTNVKKATPLMSDHNQPRIPLNENYYNLLDIEIRRWQSQIAKKFGIYGFCYYHYWFRGKLLLEKPLEMMLSDGQPDIPFCLSWANEPWTRTWDGKNHQVLMEQDYGEESDWEEHFTYLLRFFLDHKYIKINNKPVFMIYRLDQVSNFQRMIHLWNKLAIKKGLEGLYIVQIMNSFYDIKLDGVDSILNLEPMNTLRFKIPYAEIKYNINRGKSLLAREFYKYTKKVPIMLLNKIDYDYVWKNILSREPRGQAAPEIPGAFVDWDNTPRRGGAGLFIRGASPAKFQAYMGELIQKASIDYHSDYIFINAWNEWAEGAYLEPDSKNGYGYLDAIKNALNERE